MRRLISELLFVLAASACWSSSSTSQATNISDLIKSQDIRVSTTSTPGNSQLCNRILGYLSSQQRQPLVPIAASDDYEELRLSRFIPSCPSLDVRSWEDTSSLGYAATRGFRFYKVPESMSGVPSKDRYLLLGQGYFNPDIKELYKGSSIYPWAGYAWADGTGGGGFYSLINTRSCSIEIQIGVHGEFDHQHEKRTPHFSEPFAFERKLYIYDYHNYTDGSKNFSGIWVWALPNPRNVELACAYDGSDTRASIRESIGKSRE